MLARPLALPRPRRISPSLAHLFRINTLLFIVNASTGLVNYLFHVVVGHMLGPGDYGTVAALINLSYVTVLIPTTIVLTVFTRAAAALSTNGQMGELREMWTRLTLWLLIVGGVATLVFSLGLSGPIAGFLQIPGGGRAVALLGLSFLVGFAAPVNQGMLQGLQRFGWLSLVIGIGPVLRVLLAAVFIALGEGVNGAVLGLAVATLVPYAISFWPVRPDLRREPRRPIALRPWLGYSTVVAVASAATVLLYNLDTILAKHFLSAVDAGRYAALANTGKIVFFIGGSVVIVMFPKVAAAHARGEPHGHLLWFSLGATFLLSLVVVAIFVAAPGLVIVHMFGASYVTVGSDLPWYGLAMLLFALASVFTQYFLSLDDRRFLWILVLCCAGQAAGLWLWHGGVSDLVHVMLASMGILFAGLAAYYVLVSRIKIARGVAAARTEPAQRHVG
jgi:O-antigen/teichoic acid export membrane protein